MPVRHVVSVVFATAVWLGVAQSQVPQPAAEPGSVPEAQTAPAATQSSASLGARARISGGVEAGLRLGGNAPLYPADAKAQGISGTVVMHAIIGKDGSVQSLTVISGNQILAEAALDAVKTWTYTPYLLNGQPTEVDTTINVNFHLDTPPPDGPTGPASADSASPGPIKVSTRVMAGNLVRKIDPINPTGGRMGGTVVIRAIISKSGTVQSATVMSGSPMLQGAALNAVKQWRYKPYLLNGEPVDVDTTVVVAVQ